MTKAKDTPPLLLERKPLKDSMEHPKHPAEAEARMKSAFRIEKRTSYVRRSSTEPQSSSDEPERQPRKGDKTGQDPRTTRNYVGSVITQENERAQYFRTRKPQGQSCNPLKPETDKPRPGAGEESMQLGRDVAWGNARTTMPITEAWNSHPGAG